MAAPEWLTHHDPRQALATHGFLRKGLSMIRNTSAALAALAVVASAAAQVSTQPSTQSGPQAAAAASTAATEARRVVRDKETGKLRAPTTEELGEMLEQERAARAARGQPEP